MKILAYSDVAREALRTEEITDFLRTTIPSATVEERGDFFSYCWTNYELNLIGIAELMAKARVKDMLKRVSEAQVVRGEVEYELRCLRNPSNITAGVLYDGISLMTIYWDCLQQDSLVTDCTTLIFTGRLIATYSVEDGRYHARAAVLGVPSIISASGIVEAPAKPKEYYRLRREAGMNVPVEVLKEKFGRMFIDYGDDRMTEVCKGYALQAVFYILTGEQFCEDRSCRLFNAHWQEELIAAQITSGKLCTRHEGMLGELK